MLILTAKLRAKPGLAQELINLAERAIGSSRSEVGSITYELLQDPFDQESFTFFEKWRSREDLELHFKEPHFLEFAVESARITDDAAKLVSYEVANEEMIT